MSEPEEEPTLAVVEDTDALTCSSTFGAEILEKIAGALEEGHVAHLETLFQLTDYWAEERAGIREAIAEAVEAGELAERR